MINFTLIDCSFIAQNKNIGLNVKNVKLKTTCDSIGLKVTNIEEGHFFDVLIKNPSVYHQMQPKLVINKGSGKFGVVNPRVKSCVDISRKV